MDIESHRFNERVKGVAGICDNGALALFVAAVVKGFTKPDLYVLLNGFAGLVLMWIAWHIRGLLQSEE
jgi:hypothetical protein